MPTKINIFQDTIDIKIARNFGLLFKVIKDKYPKMTDLQVISITSGIFNDVNYYASLSRYEKVQK